MSFVISSKLFVAMLPYPCSNPLNGEAAVSTAGTTFARDRRIHFNLLQPSKVKANFTWQSTIEVIANQTQSLEIG